MIHAEGEVKEARRLLIHLGRRYFGEPDTPSRARVEALNDLATIEALFDRTAIVSSWEELLASVEKPG